MSDDVAKDGSAQIIKLFNFYDELTDPIRVVKENMDKEGRKNRIETLERASEHFNLIDLQNKLPNDELAEKYLDKARVDIARKIFSKAKSILKKRWFDGKLDEKQYKLFLEDSQHKESHQDMVEWSYDTCMLLDIISETKIIEYAVIKDESGVIVGDQQLPEDTDAKGDEDDDI